MSDIITVAFILLALATGLVIGRLFTPRRRHPAPPTERQRPPTRRVEQPSSRSAPSAPNFVCALPNCKIRSEHSHTEALIRRMKGQ